MLKARISVSQNKAVRFGVNLCVIGFSCFVSVSSAGESEENYIDFGVGVLSQSSAHFGQYTGLTDAGAYGLFGFGYQGEANEKGGVLSAEGKDLGLDSRSAYLEYKQQGRYKLRFDFDSTPMNRSGSVGSPYIDTGKSHLDLPTNWVGGKLISDLENLQVNDQFELATRRDKYGLLGDLRLNEQWLLKANMSQERKVGLELVAAAFGDGAAPKAVQLPSPVDRKTNSMEFGTSYFSQAGSINLLYTFSRFKNNKDSVSYDNPYTGYRNSSDYDKGGIGRTALEPDNLAHTFLVNGMFRLPGTSRISFVVKQSYLSQDDSLLPYSANPGLTDVSPELPRNSADAEVTQSYLSATYTVRPFKKANIRARYTYRKRDNDTPRDDWYIVKNDSHEQEPDNTYKGAVRVNQPFSNDRQRFDLEGGYRISRAVKATLNYQYYDHHRANNDLAVENSERNTVSARLNYRKRAFSGWLKYQSSRRRGDGYCDSCAYLNSNSSEFAPAQPGANPDKPGNPAYVNDPLLRRSFLADLDENRFIAHGNYTITRDIVLAAKLTSYQKDYVDTDFTGLGQKDGYGVNLNLNYQVNDMLSTFVYVGYDRSEGDQEVYYWNYFLGKDVGDPERGTSDDGGYDAKAENGLGGLGLLWVPENIPLSVTLDYSYFKSKVDYNNFDNHRPDGALPELKSTNHRVSLDADIRLSEKLQLQVVYVYENMSSDDFALDDLEIDSDQSINPVIYAVEEDYNYNVHYLGVAARYSF